MRLCHELRLIVKDFHETATELHACSFLAGACGTFAATSQIKTIRNVPLVFHLLREGLIERAEDNLTLRKVIKHATVIVAMEAISTLCADKYQNYEDVFPELPALNAGALKTSFVTMGAGAIYGSIVGYCIFGMLGVINGLGKRHNLI